MSNIHQHQSLLEMEPSAPAGIALENRPSAQAPPVAAPPAQRSEVRDQRSENPADWTPATFAPVSYDATTGQLTLRFTLARTLRPGERPAQSSLARNALLRHELANDVAVRSYGGALARRDAAQNSPGGFGAGTGQNANHLQDAAVNARLAALGSIVRRVHALTETLDDRSLTTLAGEIAVQCGGLLDALALHAELLQLRNVSRADPQVARDLAGQLLDALGRPG